MTNEQLKPTDKELIDFAVSEEFLLFCSEDEFVDIARSVLQRFARAAPVGEAQQCERCEREARKDRHL